MLKNPYATHFLPYEIDIKKLEDSYFFLKNESPEIYEQLTQTVLKGGKHLRPLLTFMSAEIQGLPKEKALILASTAEMIHAASLCHDDVLDEATIRRDLPTLNVLQGNKRAILSGDFLFSLALKNLCQLKNVRLVETASAMIASLSKGEWTQEHCRHTRHYPEGVIETIAFHKTASLFAWAFSAPALAMEHEQVKDEELSLLVGKELGLAFQIVDDIIDFSSNSGKEPFIDLKRGILNSVSWDYFKTNELLKAFEDDEIDTQKLCHDQVFKKSVQEMKKKAQAHIKNSQEAFEELLALHGLEKHDQRFKLFTFITENLLMKV